MKITLKCFVATGGKDPDLGLNGFDESFDVETNDCDGDELIFWHKAEAAAQALTDRFSTILEDSIEFDSPKDWENFQTWLNE